MQADQARTCQPHWLRVNDDVRSPHRVAFIDTETRPELVPGAELHTLRWWHLRHVRRHLERPRTSPVTDLAGDTIAGLAAALDQLAIAKHSLWVWTHNLGFDLQVTRLPELLYELGWTITDIGITGRSPWVRMSHGRRRLVLCDSTSWLPAPLADLGPLVGIDKPVITDWSAATDEEIAVRCLADVEILARAMLVILDWWDSRELGRWQWTGPGCGWAAFRHGYLADKILMDPDPVRLALERQAIYGGRREAYRIGELAEGNYADLDFQAAYPQIASTELLPRRAIARVPYMTAEAYGQLPADWGILSECTVTTSVPVVPCRTDGHTLYPVGTFTTVLAQPDIDGAIAAGATVELGDTIIYQLAPFLSQWGQWITGLLDGTGEQVPPVVRTMAKHWSRTVIGRFAMHAQRTEDWGDACWPSFHADPGLDWDTGCEVVDLHACGRHLRVFRDSEPENVFPAVTAWVEARCRQLLRQAMEACPAGTVIQCDTDGFMLDLTGELGARHMARPDQADGALAATAHPAPGSPVPELVGPVRVRVKALFTRAVILGPQQVATSTDRRISGVPRSFSSADGLTYTGWAWPGYTWQLARSQPGIYTRPHVTIALRGPYGSRWVLDSGRTMAPQVQIRNGVNTVIRPWAGRTESPFGQLADNQPPLLAKSAV